MLSAKKGFLKQTPHPRGWGVNKATECRKLQFSLDVTVIGDTKSPKNKIK